MPTFKTFFHFRVGDKMLGENLVFVTIIFDNILQIALVSIKGSLWDGLVVN